MTKHYKYGGSTASRTIHCPSWVDAAKVAPEQRSSSYAEEGTLLHGYMEKILEGDMTLEEVPDDDHREKCSMALEAWDDLCKQYAIADYTTEETIEISPEVGGTCDLVGWTGQESHYVIADFKFGQGIKVDPVGNSQLMFYAMLVEHKRGEPFKKLSAAIIQPIPSKSEPTLSTWDIPLDVYELFKQNFWAATQAQGLHAGDHCKFCPAAPYCLEKSGEARAALMASENSAIALADNLKMALKLEPWIADVKKEAHSQLELGTIVAGFKLVAKRAMRRWTDTDAAMRKLNHMRGIKKEDYTVSKLMTPPQVEKVFKAKSLDFKKVSAYIESASNGTTLAAEDDKRVAVMSPDALKAAMDRLA